MPIQIDLIGRLLACGRRHHLRGDCFRWRSDRRRKANFSATVVRYILLPTLPMVADAAGGGPATGKAPPMPLLAPAAGLRPGPITAVGAAIDVPPIAESTEVHDPTAIVANTLDQTQIEHRRTPTATNWADGYGACDNLVVDRVHTAATPGLGASPPGPLY